MGKYWAYPKYRDSGVEWLGEVPCSWEPIPLKYLTSFSGGGTPSKDNTKYWNGDIPWVSPKDMKLSRIASTIDNVTEIAVKESSTNLVKEGALLMVVRSGILQHSIPVAINVVPVTLNQDMKALRCNSRLNVEFAMYVIVGNQRQLLLEWSKQGATVESIEQEYLSNTFFPVPPIEQQQKIANFLDHETAKIDTLIEQQQQLIQLLKEKRQAVISHAVTKGLNPDVPMKDSGVEWLGEVPEHWEVCAIGYVSNGVFTGGTPKNESSYSDIESDLNWFGPSDFRDTRLLSESNKYLTLESHKLGDSKLFFRDSVLVIGIGATLGKVGYCNKEFSCNQQINVIYPNQRVSYKYLAIALSMQEAQMKISSNASTIGIMNQEKTKSILIAVPPREEQEQIVLSVELIESKYAKLIELAGNQVELLQERRTALISAAVTGKIDVRNFSAQLT